MLAPMPTDIAHATVDVGLRERKKDATRRALAETALALTVERGFQGFTIGELVDTVGVSRRTFSNYFTSKADCIAAVSDGWLDDVLETIRRAPATATLDEVLQLGLLAVADQAVERWGALAPLARREPELAAHVLAGDAAVVDQVAAAVAERTTLTADDMRVRLLAGYAVSAGREVLTRWAIAPRPDRAALADLLTTAFSIIDVSRLSEPATTR